MNLLSKLLDETPGLTLRSHGWSSDEPHVDVSINNKTYRYKPRGFSPQEFHEKIEKISKHSSGKALNWLKQHSDLVKSEKKESMNESSDDKVKPFNPEVHAHLINLGFSGPKLNYSGSVHEYHSGAHKVTVHDSYLNPGKVHLTHHVLMSSGENSKEHLEKISKHLNAIRSIKD